VNDANEPDLDLDLARQLRQQLEMLERAGIDRIPAPEMPRLEGASRRSEARRSDAAREAAADTAATASVASAPARSYPLPPPPPPPKAAGATLFDIAEPGEALLSHDERAAKLAELKAEVATCVRCPILVASRTQTVFGEGNPSARLMFVGEAPGETEDFTGRPFVGRAGQLLTDIITKGMGLKREDVYIANILKSRPPENRDPLPEEVRNCMPFLERQIAIIRPAFLCLLGAPAAKSLLNTSIGVSRLRGKWHRYQGIPTIVTWHPAYLLRNPPAKRDTWDDLRMLMSAMGIRPPERTRE
jgi:DNA polymerase